MTRAKCPKCQHVNPPGQTSCVRCKTPLPRVNMQSVPQSPPSSPAWQQQFKAVQFREGGRIANRYNVERMIGRGGMGCIYRVWDLTLREIVALKTLLPQYAQDQQIVDRFLNEARITRQLSHPNVVRVHDIGMHEDLLYISMEYVKGKSLRGMLDELGPGQRLPLKETLRIMVQLCDALEYAHKFTVHRDIKPENVMVTEDGTVKLMDFGISKLMSNTRLTGTSMVMGTPFYMAPEQLRNSRDADARADIYSLGVMLYEILTGNMPTGVPKPASQLTREVPPALDPIIAKCVDQDPAKRYQSAAELREALKPLLDLADTGAAPRRMRAPSPKKERGPLLQRLVGVALIAIIVGLAAVALAQLERQRREAAAAVPTGNAAPTISDFDRIPPIIDRARLRLEAKVMDNGTLQPLLDQAEQTWKVAQSDYEAGREGAAMAGAINALQTFAGPVLSPDGMVFVPPGDVTLREGDATETFTLSGFYIDAHEVTNGEFYTFCTNKNWPAPVDFSQVNANWPVSMVRYFDAEAYATAAGKTLPTEAQWARAAYGAAGASEAYPWGDAWEEEACNAGTLGGMPKPVDSCEKDVTAFGVCDMACNVSEWTCTPYQPLPYQGKTDSPPITFMTPMVVRGGNYSERVPTTLARRYTWPYETQQPVLGFRCVKAMSKQPAEIDALLSDVSENEGSES